jgi:hypothetical protein
MPYRIFSDYNEISSWLAGEMAAGVLDAIEAEAVGAPTGTGPGTGSGEHMTGIRKVVGTTAVPFTIDAATTMRHAIPSPSCRTSAKSRLAGRSTTPTRRLSTSPDGARQAVS